MQLFNPRIEAYLNVLSSRFATPFKLATFEPQVEVVPHVPWHDNIRETELLRQTNVFEE